MIKGGGLNGKWTTSGAGGGEGCVQWHASQRSSHAGPAGKRGVMRRLSRATGQARQYGRHCWPNEIIWCARQVRLSRRHVCHATRSEVPSTALSLEVTPKVQMRIGVCNHIAHHSAHLSYLILPPREPMPHLKICARPPMLFDTFQPSNHPCIYRHSPTIAQR